MNARSCRDCGAFLRLVGARCPDCSIRRRFSRRERERIEAGHEKGPPALSRGPFSVTSSRFVD